MDEELYRIACEIIDMDCTLTGQLRDGEGNFCAVGGLYTLLDPDWGAEKSNGDGSEDVYANVKDLFGVAVAYLYEPNDLHNDQQKRREAVKKSLRGAMGGNSNDQ